MLEKKPLSHQEIVRVSLEKLQSSNYKLQPIPLPKKTPNGSLVGEMTSSQQISELMKLKNIGKSIAKLLISIEVDSSEKLRKLGAKEVYLRVFEKKGWSQTLCSCLLYALEGAITDERWNEISTEKKEEFKQFSKDLHESLPGYK